MGFEPVIPVRCSTNWAMKPHIGSEVTLLSSYFPVQWSDVNSITEIIHICTAAVHEVKSDHRSKFSIYKQLDSRSLKTIRAATGFEPVTSAIPVRCSTNWAMKPHIGSEVTLLTDDHSSLHLQPQYKYELFHIYFTSLHCTEPINWPRSNVWLHSSVGRASHRYRGDHGFESRWSPDIFSGFYFPIA